jgi:3-phosphoglycerate kinase
MLKYTKTILQKVSFDKNLFKKELKKSVKWLKRDEIILLEAWCIINFGSIYSDVIVEVFK